MNYILNTKTKKVEIYWDNNNEYQAIINFLFQYILTEEKNPYIIPISLPEEIANINTTIPDNAVLVEY